MNPPEADRERKVEKDCVNVENVSDVYAYMRICVYAYIVL